MTSPQAVFFVFSDLFPSSSAGDKNQSACKMQDKDVTPLHLKVVHAQQL